MNKKRLAILFDDNTKEGLKHSFFSGILDSFKVTAEEAGYNISFLNVFNHLSGREDFLTQIENNEYQGIFLANINFSITDISSLIESNIPIVTIDCEQLGLTNVSSDNVGGIKDLTEYLISMGHKKIAYIHGDDTFVTRLRLQCFLDTCADHNLTIPPEYIRKGRFRLLDEAAYHTEQLLMLPIPPSCIIYPDDYAAIGGLNILRARGLKVPDNISIVGYDGLDIIDKLEPIATTIRQNTKEMGRISAVKLMQMVEHPELTSHDNYIVPTTLVKGHTVKRIYYSD